MVGMTAVMIVVMTAAGMIAVMIVVMTAAGMIAVMTAAVMIVVMTAVMIAVGMTAAVMTVVMIAAVMTAVMIAAVMTVVMIVVMIAAGMIAVMTAVMIAAASPLAKLLTIGPCQASQRNMFCKPSAFIASTFLTSFVPHFEKYYQINVFARLKMIELVQTRNCGIALQQKLLILPLLRVSQNNNNIQMGRGSKFEFSTWKILASLLKPLANFLIFVLDGIGTHHHLCDQLDFSH